MAMDPTFVKRPRGTTHKRAGDTFYCDDDDVLAKGRPDDVTFINGAE